ncbi:hypothetical protein OKW45_001151 [Paraburkholderia sp. WSM4175]
MNSRFKMASVIALMIVSVSARETLIYQAWPSSLRCPSAL